MPKADKFQPGNLVFANVNIFLFSPFIVNLINSPKDNSNNLQVNFVRESFA